MYRHDSMIVRAAVALACATVSPLFAQFPERGAPPPTGQPGAVIDITGYWVSQTRLLHFGAWKAPGGEPTWQADTVASWQKQAQSRGFAPPQGGPKPGGGGNLKAVTTHMKAGYLRRNGVPYSDGTILTEYFDRVELEEVPYLILTSVVNDPQYLSDMFLTSEQFKREPDGSRWNPQPCKAR